MDGETLDGAHRHGRVDGVPCRQGWRVNHGARHGQPHAVCRACGGRVTGRYGSASGDLPAEPVLCATAVRAWAAGPSLRSPGRMVPIDKATAGDWVNRAAQPGRLVLLSRWRAWPVAECQVDEGGRWVPAKDAPLALAKRGCETSGEAWRWRAFAPVGRVVLACVVGKRPHEPATRLVPRVAQVPEARRPVVPREQGPESRLALWHVEGPWVRPTRHGPRGRSPKPRPGPPPDRLEAPVVKHRQRGHGGAVTPTVVFGTAKASKARLASLPPSTTVNPSDGERENLPLRPHTRRLTRQPTAFSKELSWLAKPRGRSLAYAHLGLPHMRLRPPLEAPAPTRGEGSQRRWTPVTPARAADITAHRWTTEELRSSRVPVSFRDRLHEGEAWCQPIDEAHQGS